AGEPGVVRPSVEQHVVGILHDPEWSGEIHLEIPDPVRPGFRPADGEGNTVSSGWRAPAGRSRGETPGTRRGEPGRPAPACSGSPAGRGRSPGCRTLRRNPSRAASRRAAPTVHR